LASISQYAPAYNNRGLAEVALGQHEQALVDFDQAIQLHPQFVAAYYNRGSAKAAVGQYEKAIEDFDKVICLSPRDAIAYYNRGIARLRLGEMQKAKEDLTKAEEMGVDIAASFISFFQGGIEEFEQTFRVMLPHDIRALLS